MMKKLVAALLVTTAALWMLVPSTAKQSEFETELLTVTGTDPDAFILDGGMSWNERLITPPMAGATRRWLREDGQWTGVGLADAASAILTSAFSTTSTAWTTVIDAQVDVPGDDDRVIAGVIGAFAGGGDSNIYTLSTTTLRHNVIGTDTVTNVGNIPAGHSPAGNIAHYNGDLYAAVDRPPDGKRLIRFAPGAPGTVTDLGQLPSGLTLTVFITFVGSTLYLVDMSDRGLWSLSTLTSPSGATSVGTLPAGLNAIRSMTGDAGSLLILQGVTGEVWELTDPDDAGTAALLRTLASAVGIASLESDIYYTTQANDLFVVDNVRNPNEAATQVSDLDTRIDEFTIVPAATCQWRIARGSTAVQQMNLLAASNTFVNARFTDEPGAAGAYTYAVQMRGRGGPPCTAGRGEGVTPVPSLHVEVSYGQ